MMKLYKVRAERDLPKIYERRNGGTVIAIWRNYLQYEVLQDPKQPRRRKRGHK